MIDRIKAIIEKEGNNPSLFADSLGISRSSMNHILNGRNNPSLDFIMKILNKFPDIHSEWLLSGKLPMYKTKRNIQPSLFDENPLEPANDKDEPNYSKENEVKKEIEVTKVSENNEVISISTHSKTITKIMIFYSDNTFQTFTPDQVSF